MKKAMKKKKYPGDIIWRSYVLV